MTFDILNYDKWVVLKKNIDIDIDKDEIVESDVWVGCNVTLLAGVTVERGCIIAAEAIVIKSIPQYCGNSS